MIHRGQPRLRNGLDGQGGGAASTGTHLRRPRPPRGAAVVAVRAFYSAPPPGFGYSLLLTLHVLTPFSQRLPSTPAAPAVDNRRRRRRHRRPVGATPSIAISVTPWKASAGSRCILPCAPCQPLARSRRERCVPLCGGSDLSGGGGRCRRGERRVRGAPNPPTSRLSRPSPRNWPGSLENCPSERELVSLWRETER